MAQSQLLSSIYACSCLLMFSACCPRQEPSTQWTKADEASILQSLVGAHDRFSNEIAKEHVQATISAKPMAAEVSLNGEKIRVTYADNSTSVYDMDPFTGHFKIPMSASWKVIRDISANGANGKVSELKGMKKFVIIKAKQH